MEAFLVSSGIVALAEMGDKTQLLALILAARFQRPLPIILGILVATLLNHAGAGAVGHAVTQLIGPDWLRWILGLSFLLMRAGSSSLTRLMKRMPRWPLASASLAPPSLPSS